MWETLTPPNIGSLVRGAQARAAGPDRPTISFCKPAQNLRKNMINELPAETLSVSAKACERSFKLRYAS